MLRLEKRKNPTFLYLFIHWLGYRLSFVIRGIMARGRGRDGLRVGGWLVRGTVCCE